MGIPTFMDRAVMQTAMLMAVVVLSGCGTASEEPGRDRPAPRIEVLGRALVEQAPNRARFSVEFESRHADSATASAQVVERANRAVEAVRLASDGQVRITSDLNVRPYYQQVTRRLGEFNEQQVENVHPDALLGYVARVSVKVVVLDPEQAARARGAALAAGPVQSSAMGFYLEPGLDSQREAYRAAVADARARAEVSAEAGGASLGTLQWLQEGQGPCLGTTSTDSGRQALRTTSVRAAAPPAPVGDLEHASPKALADAADHYALAADLEPQQVEARVCAIYALKD